jgi:two-component system nitrogen regulation response regulator GlnG
MLGHAPAMQEVFRAIGRLSRSSMTVLITGNRAQARSSSRARCTVTVRAQRSRSSRSTRLLSRRTCSNPNCLATRKGAFTGATDTRRGRFEQADGGTLFLDEIGDMSPQLQTRLLRVLAEGEFYRVGGQLPVKVDVRVIAATHQDLEARVREGLFRDDLLHRLNVIRIGVPPLRNRREDIPDLLQHYLDVAALELGVAPKVLTEEAARALTAFDWPGNVRQLVNACRRLTVLAAGREIKLVDLPTDLGGSGASASGNGLTGRTRWRAGRNLDCCRAVRRCSTRRCRSSSARCCARRSRSRAAAARTRPGCWAGAAIR